MPLVGGGWLGAGQVAPPQRRQGRPGVPVLLQRHFLRCAVQLPKAQPGRDGDGQHRHGQQHPRRLSIQPGAPVAGLAKPMQYPCCMKTVMVVMLVLVVAALASAGLFMLRRPKEGDGENRQMARALAVRVGLSVALFLFVLLSWAMGWVRPGGLPTGG
jgi:hypothetical protein